MLTVNKQGEGRISNESGDEDSKSLKIQHLTKQLQMRNNQIIYLQHKIDDQNSHIESLEQQVDNLHKEIKELSQKSIKQIKIKQQDMMMMKQQIRRMQQQLVQIGRIWKQNKNKKLEQYHFEQQDKLNKVLTHENNQLVKHKKVLEGFISILQTDQQSVLVELKASKQQNFILDQLNSQLRVQVQQLLFQIRMLNRRADTYKMQAYQSHLDNRLQLTQNQNYINKQNLQELVSLLKLRITSLEQQIKTSQQRSKQLQKMLLQN